MSRASCSLAFSKSFCAAVAAYCCSRQRRPRCARRRCRPSRRRYAVPAPATERPRRVELRAGGSARAPAATACRYTLAATSTISRARCAATAAPPPAGAISASQVVDGAGVEDRLPQRDPRVEDVERADHARERRAQRKPERLEVRLPPCLADAALDPRQQLAQRDSTRAVGAVHGFLRRQHAQVVCERPPEGVGQGQRQWLQAGRTCRHAAPKRTIGCRRRDAEPLLSCQWATGCHRQHRHETDDEPHGESRCCNGAVKGSAEGSRTYESSTPPAARGPNSHPSASGAPARAALARMLLT